VTRGARLVAALTAGAAVVAALAPQAAHAHGIVQRTSLPIPEWLFGWAAAIVLVVSFVGLALLWPSPRLQDPPWLPLPGGRALGSRVVEFVCGAIGVALLAIVIYAGYEGGGSGVRNPPPERPPA
jgi:branched-subunit amino acid permease